MIGAVLLSIICLLGIHSLAVTADDKLQVHLIMHSHDDPGWLKTADQYYTGANASVYLASVQYIFDSVVTELSKDPSRHFTFCEISFMSRWYYEQNAQTKAKFKNLVNNGQITIVNGGWVMHDEAGVHYVSMIDQTTLGHKFLKEELNYLPRVGWQIDPFGHSNTHAWLSSAVGFDSLFFGRIDYQDRKKRMDEKNMEMVWKGSVSDADQAVFTGAFTSGNYHPPRNYCFDTSCHYCRDDPVTDAEYLEDRNVDAMVAGYIEAILTEHSTSRGNNIMLETGADFTGDNSHTWFKNMDKLIARVNADPRFNVFYSDPLTYTKARAAETDIQWSVKTDDFFPYSDHQHAFWAGYFTSRPTLKHFERTASGLLQILKQITSSPSSAVRVMRAEIDQVVFRLTAAVGLLNHHDAITGTSKQHVADDYTKILAKAVTGAEKMVAKVLGARLSPAEGDKYSTKELASEGPRAELTMCRLLNESICDATQSLKAGDSALVTVYNPLPRARTQQVTVPLTTNAHVTVFAAPRGEAAEAGAMVPSDLVVNQNQVSSGSAPYSLVFTAANVAALSTVTFVVRLSSHATMESTTLSATEKVGTDLPQLTVSSDRVEVTFNTHTGLMDSITRKDVQGADGAPLTAKVSQDLAYYKSFGSPGLWNFTAMVDERDPHIQNVQPKLDHISVHKQPGGAYVMRSSEPHELPTRISPAGSKVQLTVTRGKALTEVKQQFGSWGSQVVRLRDGSPAVEIEWTVGPVPIEDRIGKEVISKITSDLSTGGTGHNKFYTDSNGREFMPRQYNYRPTWDLDVYEPISGNYYPVTTAMYVQDTVAHKQLAVLTDRAEAGASLFDGEMELLVHRRLLVDDLRGVGEPLNETTGGMSHYPTWKRSGDGITVTGKHQLLLSKLDSGMKEVRTLIDELYLPLVPLFSSDAQTVKAAALTPSPALAAAALSQDLPLNVQLVTLQATSNTELLVRLAHQYAVGEDAVLSAPVSVDLFALLSSYHPVSAQEMTLSANQLKSEQLAAKIQWPTEQSAGAAGAGAGAGAGATTAVQEQSGAIKPSLRRAAVTDTTYMVELYAMQIKTYLVQLPA